MDIFNGSCLQSFRGGDFRQGMTNDNDNDNDNDDEDEDDNVDDNK